MHHPFDLQTRPAEIKQQAKLNPGRFEVIDALHPVCVFQCFDGLQLHQKQSPDQQVDDVVPDD